MFRGSIVALVTPFNNGQIDDSALRRLIAFHIENGTDAILVSGCTGEAATLSVNEMKHLIMSARDEINKGSRSIPLIAGTGTNSTSSTIERTRIAAELGVDGVLLITPYYNKPTPAGQIAHFTSVVNEVPIPAILYNVPSRTGTNLLPETVAELADHPCIVALKEAGGNLDQVSRLHSISSIVILSGDDSLTLPMLSVGAQGVISVTANIDPKRVSDMCSAWDRGDVNLARKLHYELFDLTKSLFIETNPMPVKAALELMGLIRGDIRLPLVPVKPESREKIQTALIRSGLING